MLICVTKIWKFERKKGKKKGVSLFLDKISEEDCVLNLSWIELCTIEEYIVFLIFWKENCRNWDHILNRPFYFKCKKNSNSNESKKKRESYLQSEVQSSLPI